MKILSTSLIFIILIFSFSSLHAGEPYFKTRSKALLFEFSGLDNLGANSYNGGIGGKYFIDNRMAIRGSLQFMNINETIPDRPVPRRRHRPTRSRPRADPRTD